MHASSTQQEKGSGLHPWPSATTFLLQHFLPRLMRATCAQAESDLPPFHYGSHYSAAGVVLFYLIRLEPFTRLNRNLQVSVHACMLSLQRYRSIAPLSSMAKIVSSQYGRVAENHSVIITLLASNTHDVMCLETSENCKSSWHLAAVSQRYIYSDCILCYK